MGKKHRKVGQQNQNSGKNMKGWSPGALVIFVLVCGAASHFYLDIFSEHYPTVRALIDAEVTWGWQGALTIALMLAIGTKGALLGLFAAAGTQELLSRT